MKRDTRRLLFATSIVVSVAAALTACSSGEDSSVPKATGPDAGVILLVDCGEDGVGVVKVSYGVVDDEFMVGRNSTTQSIGGYKTLSRNYGSSDDGDGATLTVSTNPTRGTCATSLTDENGGEILAEKETAGKVELSAFVPAG
ncbi:hypothetical protein ACFRFQ_17780 [Rhodococcus sp. NPDC056743]|uniref:hypothetical protein n=1 Tax=Rhodococcus sp. NPDC056743 TaxID=3345934 RepID=UPI00367158A0